MWVSKSYGELEIQCRVVDRDGVDTHIDEMLPVADQQVPKDSCLIQVSQPDHVLHSMDGGGVHGFDVAGKISQMVNHWDEGHEQSTLVRRTR